jgi:hypothetical protein
MERASDNTPQNPERSSNSMEGISQVGPASVWASTGVGSGSLNQLQGALLKGRGLRVEDVLTLQRTVGNRDVQRLLAARAKHRLNSQADAKSRSAVNVVQRLIEDEFEESEFYKRATLEKKVTEEGKILVAKQGVQNQDIVEALDRYLKESVDREYKRCLDDLPPPLVAKMRQLYEEVEKLKFVKTELAEKPFVKGEWEDEFKTLNSLFKEINQQAGLLDSIEQLVGKAKNAILAAKLDIQQFRTANKIQNEGMWNFIKHLLLKKEDFDITAAERIHTAVEKNSGIEQELAAGQKSPMRLTKIVYGALYGLDIEQDIRKRYGANEAEKYLKLLNAPYNQNYKDVDAPVGTKKFNNDTEAVSVFTNLRLDKGETAQDIDFAHKYEGGKAVSSRWLQFCWNEVYLEMPGTGEKVVGKGLIETSRGGMELSVDAGQPKIFVDAVPTSKTPYYEDQGQSARDVNRIEIYDRPSVLSNLEGVFIKLANGPQLKEIFDKTKGAKVVSKMHFDTFLMQDHLAKTHTGIVVVNEWEAVPPISGEGLVDQQNKRDVKEITPPGEVGGLPGPFRMALVKDYPDYDYLK